jgi:hypothetical protein
MKPRCRFWLGLSFLVILGAAFVHPGVYWPVVGWVRGEAFYKGRPTSYWHGQLNHYEELFALISSDWYLIECQPIASAQWLRSFFGVKADHQGYALLDGDPQALRVLLEMVQYSDFKARRVAVTGLGYVGPQAKHAMPILVEMAQTTPDYALYVCTGIAIWSIDREWAEANKLERTDLSPTSEMMP